MTPEQTADVLAAHERMCWWVARRIGGGLTAEDLADVAAEVRLLFVRSAATFDPTTGTSFGTYALPFAERQARRVARRMRAAGVRVPLNYAVADVPTVTSAHVLVGPGEQLIDVLPDRATGSSEATDFWQTLGRDCGVTPRERELLTLLYRDGLLPSEVVALGGWGGLRKVYRITFTAKRKLRKSAALLESLAA